MYTRNLFSKKSEFFHIQIYIHINKLFIDNKIDSKRKQITFNNMKRMKYSIENEVLDQIIELGERQEQLKSTLKRNEVKKIFNMVLKHSLNELQKLLKLQLNN